MDLPRPSFPPLVHRRLPGVFRPAPDSWIVLHPGSGLGPGDADLARLRVRAAEVHCGGRAGCRVPLAASPAFTPCGWRLEVDPRLPAEEHRVRVETRQARIAGGSTQALRRGIRWLLERMEGHSPRRPLPAQELIDRPDFPRRGFMLDISRCKVPGMPALAGELPDCLDSLRLNEAQLYSEHTFAFAGHETVWRDASPLLPDEVLLLDGLFHARGIDLAPNFNSFGHFERWLRHPAYFKHAESPRGFTYPSGRRMPWGTVLRPNAASLRLVDSLHAQLLPHFRSAFFNVGCDETWELGQGWSRSLCRRRGKYRVYLDFLLGIHRLVSRRGRRMQFWGDIILKAPELIPELPREGVALAWGYEADHPFEENGRKFRDSGIPWHVCPGTSSWRSLSGRDTNLRGNLKAAASAGRNCGAAGFLLTDWGDEGHHQVWPVSFNGLALAARLAWRTEAAGADRDAEALANRHLFQDPSGRASAAFAGLGRLGDGFRKRFTNSAIFHHLLFARTPPDWMGEVAPGELREARARLRDLRAQDGAAGCADPRIAEEFHHTCRMLDAALRRGLAFLGRGRDLAEKDWRRLRESHRRQWLARNRPGGLEESLGHFPGG